MPIAQRPVSPVSPQRQHPRSSGPRLEALRTALPATVGLLKAHRAGEIAELDIDDYVSLNWMEWNGGSLQLTVTGSNVCLQQRLR
jgi:hypothetical protein